MFWKQLIAVIFSFSMNLFLLGQLSVVFSPLNPGLASNQKTSFHDVTILATTATMAKNNIQGKIPQIFDVKL